MVFLKTVLIVTESEDFGLALRDSLRDDYSVTVCGDARAGAELLRQRPDALVLDLFLPGTDGLTFLKNTQSIRPPAVLMLTRFINEDILRAASELGVDHVIMKPCAVSSVVTRLSELLA